jgi:steroid delta-isomerase-like uncharacterized protein
LQLEHSNWRRLSESQKLKSKLRVSDTSRLGKKMQRATNRTSELVQRFAETVNDPRRAIELFSDSAEVKVPGLPDKAGKGEFEQFLQGFHRGFPDARMEILSTVESGDRAAAELVYSGTNSGPVATPDGRETPPTGKRVAIPGSFFIKVRDGKIASFHGYFDQAVLAQQIGLASGRP